MERYSGADCTLTVETEAARRLEWHKLHELVLEVHELTDGVVVDLPADRYEEIIDLVERERECCGSWLTLDLARKKKVILLTATSEDQIGRSQIRSMVGLTE